MPTQNNSPKSAFEKAKDKHIQFIERTKKTIADGDMNHFIQEISRRCVQEYIERLAVLIKMANSENISAEEHKLVMRCPSIREKPEFINYPHVIKPSVQRRNSV